MRKHVNILLLFGLFMGGSAYAQETPRPHPGPLRFYHQEAEHLYQTSAILQDHEGFMWFGQVSSGQVYRYDGYEYKQFANDPYDSLSIGAGRVQVLFEDRATDLWVGGETGLSRFDRETETFSNFNHDPDDSASISPGWVNDILEDRQGNLWVGTWLGGVNLLDRESGTISHFLPDSINTWIGKLFEDSEGTIWAGSWGLNRFNPSTGTFTPYLPYPSIAEPLSSNYASANWVTAIHEDPRGRLWVGTVGGGLYLFDRETESFTNYRHNPSLPLPFASDQIYTIVDDPAGGLWLATRREGLVWFDPETGEMTAYRNDPTDQFSLSGDNVQSLYEDSQGVFWMGTFWHDVSRFDRAASPFEHYYSHVNSDDGLLFPDVASMAEASAGVVWVVNRNTGISSDRVLTRVDRNAGTYDHFQHNSADPGGLANRPDLVFVDASGTLWTANLDGVLSRMDSERPGRFTHFEFDPADARTLPAGRVRALFEDTRGRLWAGTSGYGLSRVDDRERGFVTRYPFGEGIGTVNNIFEDSAGILWVGTYGGLFRFDPETEQYERFRQDNSNLATDLIFGIYERPQEPGVLWLGMLPVGLGRFEPATGDFRLFTTKDGLPDNGAQGVLGDDDGGLWISTDIGLSRLDPETGGFTNYDMDDGLQGKSFTAWSYHKGKSGQLYFGGPRGLNVFYPGLVSDNPYPPQVALTSLRLGREVVKPGEAGPLFARLAETESLTLSHSQNDLTLEYVGLHFRQPDKNRYSYILEGYDTEWSDTTAIRQATYTNLPPSDYTFRVTAANSDGVWNEEPVSLSITILPPWWRTWWAYTIYLLLVVGAVVQSYRWQHARVVRRERDAARERDLEQAREIERQHAELTEAHDSLKKTQAQLIESEKLASLGALTSGIAHEIKNPLNFVNNFAEVSTELTDELSEAVSSGNTEEVASILKDLRENTMHIARHGKRADSIVSSMMQHARGGSSESEVIDVNQFIEEYLNLAWHGMRAREHGFQADIERDLADDAGSITAQPQELGRVVLNLLNNAFYAVTDGDAEKPAVLVSTRREKSNIEISIADNGPGIPDDLRSRIFEPFFTTKPTGKGTGLGLSISYDIITKGHGGMMRVEEVPGGGARFVITLPVS